MLQTPILYALSAGKQGLKSLVRLITIVTFVLTSLVLMVVLVISVIREAVVRDETMIFLACGISYSIF
jgi:hypothetical protein